MSSVSDNFLALRENILYIWGKTFEFSEIYANHLRLGSQRGLHWYLDIQRIHLV